MKDQLYIDNKVVDIDDNTNITLNYNSNMFTDVSKIVSNNTYSIKLPLTVRNCLVIDNAHIPSYMTRYPRINHKGRYLRNGVEIVSDANVTLMEITDTIDIAMAWGNVSAFADIVNDGKKLQDLSYGDIEGEDYSIWEKKRDSNRFPRIDYGFNVGEENTWYHPVVTVKWVLDKICDDSGVTFQYPSGVTDDLESLMIPLLSRNDSPSRMEKNKVNLIFGEAKVVSQSNGPAVEYRMKMGFKPVTSNLYMEWLYDSFNSGSLISGIRPLTKTSTIHIKWKVSLRFETTNVGEPEFNFGLYNPERKEMIAGFDYTTAINEGTSDPLKGRWLVTYDIDREFDVSVDEILQMDISTDWYSGFVSVSVVECDTMALSPFLENIALYKGDGNNFYSHYYFVPNLPDIKQIDFIKAISALCGCFAMPMSGGIKFVRIDDIIANKPKALNWTKRVVASYKNNRPKTLSFSVDGFAQKNIYKWKDDDDGIYDGVVYVDDATLDEESNVITLPFAASEVSYNKGYSGCAYIPLYSYGQNGELEYNDNVTPRLLLRKVNSLSSSDGVFAGLDWNSIIQDKYKMYQDVVREPKVITELIEIREYELRDLDMSIPVYLAQYGKYYAIISIKAEKTGICECKLFQL